MRRKRLYLILILLVASGMSGCSSNAPVTRSEAPLATGATVAPPPGCQALRARGGSC